MALDRYGVLVGRLQSHFRDRPGDGRHDEWYHVNLRVRAAGQKYRVAVDVDSHDSDVGVEWKTVDGLTAAELGPVARLGEGYHDLARSSASGAVDYQRSRWMDDAPPWTRGSNVEAAAAFEPLLAEGTPGILIFGQPFTAGRGMHKVHQNQGDPAHSQWWVENGTWQDGTTLVRRPDGTWSAFLSKFTSQSSSTDGAGHPR